MGNGERERERERKRERIEKKRKEKIKKFARFFLICTFARLTTRKLSLLCILH